MRTLGTNCSSGQLAYAHYFLLSFLRENTILICIHMAGWLAAIVKPLFFSLSKSFSNNIYIQKNDECSWKEQREKTDLRRYMWGLEAKFMHDPTRFDSIGSSVPVKHQSLSHPYHLLCSWVDHHSILPCCFPVASCCSPIRSEPRGILSVTKVEEVPLIGVHLCHLFNFKSHAYIYNKYN